MPEKINLEEIEEVTRSSPKGRYALSRKGISQALEGKTSAGGGGDPFDVEWVRLHPGKINFPFHMHHAQWEFYMVVSGKGVVRRDDREFAVGPGDCFLQPPGTAHNIRNASDTEDLVYFVIADNPPVEVVHYPDSGKWAFRPPRKVIELKEVNYYKGEE